MLEENLGAEVIEDNPLADAPTLDDVAFVRSATHIVLCTTARAKVPALREIPTNEWPKLMNKDWHPACYKQQKNVDGLHLHHPATPPAAPPPRRRRRAAAEARARRRRAERLARRRRVVVVGSSLLRDNGGFGDLRCGGVSSAAPLQLRLAYPFDGPAAAAADEEDGDMYMLDDGGGWRGAAAAAAPPRRGEQRGRGGGGSSDDEGDGGGRRAARAGGGTDYGEGDPWPTSS